MRQSSGGYRFVKAMGVLVEGRAQVSMNLTNFKQSPIARIVETIRREAQRYGVAIHHSELVGLTPQEALIESAVWYTQLDEFKSDQILENRMYEVIRDVEVPVKTSSLDFLDRLASSDATPGGGSAAAYTGASAAALVSMVGRVTVGKKKYVEVEPEMFAMVEKSESLRKQLSLAIEEDSQSFEKFLEATRMPKNTPEEIEARTLAMEEGKRNAALVPLGVAKLCLEVMDLAKKATSLGNINAISDAASAGYLAQAALRCAVSNVKVNIKSLQNPVEMQDELSTSEALEIESDEKVFELRKIIAERAGF
jgi:glutamate formiminotransferase/formiminotetrahydrofolate cyclodeaminase